MNINKVFLSSLNKESSPKKTSAIQNNVSFGDNFKRQNNNTIRIGNNAYELKIIEEENKKCIKPFVAENNGRYLTITPVTYSIDDNAKVFGVINFEGEILEPEPDERYVLYLRSHLGRELVNYDMFASPGLINKITKNIPFLSNIQLFQLKFSNPEKFNMVCKILDNTYLFTKTKQGISEEYISKFIEKLIESNEKLLKTVANKNIPIKLYDDAAFYFNLTHARYTHGKAIRMKNNMPDFNRFGNPVFDKSPNPGFIQLCEKYNGKEITVDGIAQNTYNSLPHELGHVYDYNMGDKLNLHKQNIISTVNGEDYSRFSDLISFSKEFDEALAKDIINMSESDVKEGRKYGQTFYDLLKDSDFSYYFGVNSNNEPSALFNDTTARKELFAQMVSYATSGMLTNKNFQNRIETLFPNALAFTTSLFN